MTRSVMAAREALDFAVEVRILAGQLGPSSSVGRALPRYGRGHRFEPDEGLGVRRADEISTRSEGRAAGDREEEP